MLLRVVNCQKNHFDKTSGQSTVMIVKRYVRLLFIIMILSERRARDYEHLNDQMVGFFNELKKLWRLKLRDCRIV